MTGEGEGICFRSNFRVITRLETLATQANQSFELLFSDLLLLIQTDNSAAFYGKANSIVGFNLISFSCCETGPYWLR